MPRVRMLRGVVVQGRDREPGDILEVTERDARSLVDVYHDAEYVGDEIQVAVPDVQYRDPVVRRKKS